MPGSFPVYPIDRFSRRKRHNLIESLLEVKLVAVLLL